MLIAIWDFNNITALKPLTAYCKVPLSSYCHQTTHNFKSFEIKMVQKKTSIIIILIILFFCIYIKLSKPLKNDISNAKSNAADKFYLESIS